MAAPALSEELTAQVSVIFAIAPLLCDKPKLASAVDILCKDVTWLRCFLSMCNSESEATAQLIISYTSWCLEYSWLLPSATPNAILKEGLIDILIEDSQSESSGAIAVIRDISILSRLLQAHSIEAVVGAHVYQLRRLLETCEPARGRGVSMVQDLSALDLSV